MRWCWSTWSLTSNGAYHHQQQTGFLNNNPQLKAFLGAVYKDEAAHVSLLRAALGKAQIRSPKFDFHGTNMNERDFIATSSTLEEPASTRTSAKRSTSQTRSTSRSRPPS